MPLSEISITDLVPSKERTRVEYRVILDRMKQDLKNPSKVFRYATHEAGHFIYFKQTKLVSSMNDYIYAGPTIYFEDHKIKSFNAAVNSKHARLSDDTLEYTEELLDNLALVGAAGMVFETELLGEDEDTANAGGGDEARLHEFCHKAMTDWEIPYRKFTLWKSAHKRVTEYVQSNRAEIDRKVEETRKTIFEECFKLDAALFAASLVDFPLNDTTH